MIEKTWTEEKFNEAKRLFEAGLTYAEIADKIGATRNAVSGKFHREEMKRGKPAPRQQEPRRLTLSLLDLLPAPSALRIPLLELEPHHCRWIVDTSASLFCGHDKQSGSSYCPHHHSLAYEKRRPIAESMKAQRIRNAAYKAEIAESVR